MKETEKALVLLLEVGTKVKDALADDGKVDFGESIAISMKAIGLIGVFKALPEIRVELKNSTNADRVALVEVFKEKFDLPDDEAELNIEQGIEVLVQLVNMIWGKEAE